MPNRPRPPVPPPQENLKRATELGLAALADQPDEQLRWLGAEPSGDVLHLTVLGDTLEIDSTRGRITTADGVDVSPAWRILVLHYLAISGRPDTCEPAVTFADLATARSYAGVYQGRVISRFCATAGRTGEGYGTAAESLCAQPVEAGDLGFDFQAFPRITLRLIWHAPDEEFPPSAVMLLPENIEQFLCAEDIVVLSESLVARLSGKPF